MGNTGKKKPQLVFSIAFCSMIWESRVSAVGKCCRFEDAWELCTEFLCHKAAVLLSFVLVTAVLK